MSDSPDTPKYTRHDGWTIARRRTFLVALAKGASIGEACRGAGLSRQAAYGLRARDPRFAALWSLARAQARSRPLPAVPMIDAHHIDAAVVLDGVQVGRRRLTSGALMRRLRWLDKMAEGRAMRQADATPA